MTADRRQQLAAFRERLEATDDRLLEVLRDRARLVEEIWRWKAEHGVPLFDAAREAEVKARLHDRAAALGLDPAAVGRLLELVIGKRLLR